MRYYIDGYNLLFKVSSKNDSLQKEREQLIAELSEMGSLFHLEMVLVFDGSFLPPEKATRHHYHTLEIVYTPKEQSADAYIISAVELGRNPAEITVITSDKGLASQCRAQGAHAQTIRDFIAFLRKKKEKKPKEMGIRPPRIGQDKELNRYLELFEKRLREL